jgi:integrase
MKDYKITTEIGRTKLSPRREPYWRRLDGTGYIGFRKMTTESWIARWRGEDSKLFFETLGRVSKINNFAAASKQARGFFQRCEIGMTDIYTVKDACEAYIANFEEIKGADAAVFPDNQFNQTVYKHPLAEKRLDKLKPEDVRKWLHGLVNETRQQNSANRIFCSLKAALNFAYRNEMTDRKPWDKVERFHVRDGRRNNYLDKTQVRTLLDAAPDDLKALLMGYLYIGCRPGELPKAKVSDLDVENRTLTISTNKGKNGTSRPRLIELDDERLAFFKKQTRFKKPGDHLMTMVNRKPWNRITWGFGIRAIREKYDSLPDDLCIYDLRHTTISNWLAAGFSISQVESVAGTSAKEIRDHYKKFIKNEIAEKFANVKIM